MLRIPGHGIDARLPESIDTNKVANHLENWEKSGKIGKVRENVLLHG